MRILRIISSMFSAGSFTIPARPCGRTATFPFVLGSCTRCGPARSRGTTRWSIFELQPSLPDSLIFIRTASKSTKQKGRSYSAHSISHCANPWLRSELSAGEILSRGATAICAISSCVNYVRNFHGAPDRRPSVVGKPINTLIDRISLIYETFDGSAMLGKDGAHLTHIWTFSISSALPPKHSAQTSALGPKWEELTTSKCLPHENGIHMDVVELLRRTKTGSFTAPIPRRRTLTLVGDATLCSR